MKWIENDNNEGKHKKIFWKNKEGKMGEWGVGSNISAHSVTWSTKKKPRDLAYITPRFPPPPPSPPKNKMIFYNKATSEGRSKRCRGNREECVDWCVSVFIVVCVCEAFFSFFIYCMCVRGCVLCEWESVCRCVCMCVCGCELVCL